MSDLAAIERVKSAVMPMRNAMGLNDWDIRLRFEILPSTTIGECFIDLPYKRASITIDTNQHDGEDEMLETLRHELIHLFMAYYAHARTTVGQFLNGDSFDAVDVGFTLAAEHSVGVIETFFNKSGLSGERLIEMGSKGASDE